MKGRLLVLWVLTAIALLGSASVILVSMIKPGAILTQKDLTAARARWQKNGMKDYDLELELNGALKGLYAVQVRGGEVTKMTIDGRAIDERTRKLWNIEGLFRFLQDDLDNCKHPKKVFGVDDPEQVILRAAFNEKNGVPSWYLRHVSGTGQEIRWEFLRLEERE